MNISRPYPSKQFIEAAEQSIFSTIQPAPEVMEWVRDQVLDEQGAIYNQEHWHLIDADIEFMWATQVFTKKGKTVLGQCEQLMFRVGGWQKVRQEQQFYQWFGRVPKFIITLAADYCFECSDTDFCALVEHELYHIAQEIGPFDEPKFSQDGLPKLTMASHDVEEFTSVVKRYGPSEEVMAMVEAARQSPSVSKSSISAACGTCLKAVA